MLKVLRRRLEELKKSGPTDDVLITFSTLINQEENSDQKDALVEDGLAVLESNPNEEARDFRLAAAGVFVDHAIQERDAGNPTAQHRQAERGRRILSPLLDREAVQRDPYDLALGAMLAEVEEDPSAAFELYERVLGTDVHEGQRVRALLGLLRTGILASQHESVVHYGSSMLDLVVQRYAVEVDEAELAQRAEDLSDAVTHIATSCIALGDLEHLLLTLERASSARLRHRSLLRRGRSGRRIRQLEEALWGVGRGAPVDAREAGLAAAEGRAAAALTLRSRLQETYRTAAQQVTERFDPPILTRSANASGRTRGSSYLVSAPGAQRCFSCGAPSRLWVRCLPKARLRHGRPCSLRTRPAGPTCLVHRGNTTATPEQTLTSSYRTRTNSSVAA
jgi:hypothetical protein